MYACAICGWPGAGVMPDPQQTRWELIASKYHRASRWAYADTPGFVVNADNGRGEVHVCSVCYELFSAVSKRGYFVRLHGEQCSQRKRMGLTDD